MRKETFTKRLLIIPACLLFFACSNDSRDPSLSFENAWIRPIPPGSMMTAGFGKLINHSGSEIRISGYSSPQFADVSLHQTVSENGVSRMQAVAELRLPAGGAVELTPGGYHLMLMHPVQAEFSGVLLHIDLADGKRVSFELGVERR